MKLTIGSVSGAALVLLLAVVALAGSAPPASAQASGLDIVQTDAGLVAPARDSTEQVHVYKMIPFAAAPIGDLRWKPPQPVAPWQGVRRADYFSPMCMQTNWAPTNAFYDGDQGMSEDCLYLNLWTPAKSSAEKLPVLFFIYGGSNVRGTGTSANYNGAALAQKGVIVVTFNFRMGVFGWLAHPELTNESGSIKASGNYGFLDMIAALKWVQANIAAFGGDPQNVTLMSHSSGARDANVLTASPLAKGLFSKVIGQSGSEFRPPFLGVLPLAKEYKLADAEQAGADWAKNKFKANTIAELRSKSAWDLVKAPLPYAIIVDGYVLPDSVQNIYAGGQQNDVPILIGWTKDEGTVFPAVASTVASYTVAAQSGTLASTVVSYTAAAQLGFGTLGDLFLKTYPAATDAEAYAQSIQLTTDNYGWKSLTWARAHDANGQTHSYVYHWTHAPTWQTGLKIVGVDVAKLGAHHAVELKYVFQHLDLYTSQFKYTDLDYQLSDTVSSYWVNFARTGDPNGPGLPAWPVFDAESANPLMYIGAQVQPGPIPHKAGIDFWEAYYSSTQPLTSK